MAEFTFICAFCNRRIRADEGYRGMKINCPGCGNELDIGPAPKTEFPKTALDLHNETVAGAIANAKATAQQPTPIQFTSLKSYVAAFVVIIVAGGFICWGIYTICVRFPSQQAGQINVARQEQPSQVNPATVIPVAQTKIIAEAQAAPKNAKQIESDFKRIQVLLDFNPHFRFDFDLDDSLEVLIKKRDGYTDIAESQEKLVKDVIDDLGNNGFLHCDAMKRMEYAWFRAYAAMVEDEKNWKFYSRMNMQAEADNARQDSSRQLQTMLSYSTAINQCQFQE